MKQFWFAAFFFLLVNTASAAIVAEYSFASLGNAGFAAEGIEQESCADLNLSIEPELLASGIFPVLTLVADFAPVNTGTGGVFTWINDLESDPREPDLKAAARDFLGGKNRLVMDATRLRSGLNRFRVCANTSASITRIRVAPDSLIGFYAMAYFDPLLFTKTVETEKPVVGQETAITISAKNTGSEAAYAGINFRDQELRVLQITRGDSDFEGEIKPGEEKVLTYYVKPRFAGTITPVSARLFYTDIFGQSLELKSTRPTVEVIEIPFEVSGLLLAATKTAKPGEAIGVQISVKNRGETDLSNVLVELQKSDLLEANPQNFTIPELKAGQTVVLSAFVSSPQEGIFQLSCAARLDQTSQRSRCDSATFTIRSEVENPGLLLAAALLVIGALVYAYVYHVPKKRTTQPE